jgi:ankyrin repeat protein
MSTPNVREVRDFTGAAQKGNIRAMEGFLSKFPDGVNAKDQFGRTALINAAMYDRDDSIAFLLQRGADANIRDNGGMTAYVLATANARRKAIAALERQPGFQKPRINGPKGPGF